MVEKNFMPSSFHEFALQDMAHSNGERFELCRHEPGREESAWLYFFPGTQLSRREALLLSLVMNLASFGLGWMMPF